MNVPVPPVQAQYQEDVAVYGREATMEKLALESALREEGSLGETRCATVSNVWFATVFLRCTYSEDVLEGVARDLLLVPERELRLSLCRRFVDALGPDVVAKIKDILP